MIGIIKETDSGQKLVQLEAPSHQLEANIIPSVVTKIADNQLEVPNSALDPLLKTSCSLHGHGSSSAPESDKEEVKRPKSSHGEKSISTQQGVQQIKIKPYSKKPRNVVSTFTSNNQSIMEISNNKGKRFSP